MTAINVNVDVDIFNTVVKEIFDKHAPAIEKRMKGDQCPCIDDGLIKQGRPTRMRIEEHTKLYRIHATI